MLTERTAVRKPVASDELRFSSDFLLAAVSPIASRRINLSYKAASVVG
jgi:hypothetical protein